MSKLSKAISDTLPDGQSVSDQDVFTDTMREIDPNGNANDLPANEAGQNFDVWGQSFKKNPTLQEDYMRNIAVKYGVVFFKNWVAKNPLSMFKRGLMPQGGKIESQVFDVLKPKYFRPDLYEGKNSPWARHFGRIVADTYTYAEDLQNNVTIQDTVDPMFYQNLEGFNDYVFGRISSLVNGFYLQEYFDTKQVISRCIANGKIGVTQAADNSKDLAKKLLYYSKILRYFNNNHNAYSVTQATTVDDLVVIVPVNTSINLDVDYFSNVFNEEMTEETKIKRVEIDRFPDIYTFDKDHTVTNDDIAKGYIDGRQFPEGSVVTAGNLCWPDEQGKVSADASQKLDGKQIGAVILDRDALQLWDQLPLTLSGQNNPYNRYVNIFGNKKTYMMFVQALNAVAITIPEKLACDPDDTFGPAANIPVPSHSHGTPDKIVTKKKGSK